MDELILPWWLILLIGMWAAALATWQHPAVHREVRLWAGLLTLVYLGLFFLALGKTSAGDIDSADNHSQMNLAKVGFGVCVFLSLASSIWFVGRGTDTSRKCSYVLLTTANSAAAFLMQSYEIAVGLFLVAALAAWPLLRIWWRSRTTKITRTGFRNFIQFHEETVSPESSGVIWLAGALYCVLTCLLLGTIAFSVRYEASRTKASTRLTALPQRNVLERNHEKSVEKAAALNFIFGSRAEIFVLLAVIVFVCLAIASGEESQRKSSQIENLDGCQSDPISTAKLDGLI